jgi:hypothetical protein
MAFDMLLDSAGDEEPKGDVGVVLEEGNESNDELLNLIVVFAFVEAVDDDEECVLDESER